MKKNVIATIVIFFLIFIVSSLLYYFFNKHEIEVEHNYSFIIYCLIGASAVIFVPILQWLFRVLKN